MAGLVHGLTPRSSHRRARVRPSRRLRPPSPATAATMSATSVSCSWRCWRIRLRTPGAEDVSEWERLRAEALREVEPRPPRGFARAGELLAAAREARPRTPRAGGRPAPVVLRSSSLSSLSSRSSIFRAGGGGDDEGTEGRGQGPVRRDDRATRPPRRSLLPPARRGRSRCAGIPWAARPRATGLRGDQGRRLARRLRSETGERIPRRSTSALRPPTSRIAARLRLGDPPGRRLRCAGRPGRRPARPRYLWRRRRPEGIAASRRSIWVLDEGSREPPASIPAEGISGTFRIDAAKPSAIRGGATARSGRRREGRGHPRRSRRAR